MSVVKVENLTFSYDGCPKPVFENLSFSFDTCWKTGFIGRNGIGKSTFFKLLLGEESHSGKIIKSQDCIKFPPEIRDMSKNGLELFREFLTDRQEWEFVKELSLLKLDNSLIYREFQSLSMGERSKILLAILFMKEDGFLLIDEPTNHLDMEGRGLVSNYLKGKEGFLLISHDRDFLDGCIDHVISINRNSIDIQAGNFSSWYQNKLLKDSFEMSRNERLKKDIKRLEQAAEQSKAWSDKIEKSKMGNRVSGVKPDKGHIGHQSAKMMKKSKNLEKRQKKAIEEKQGLLKDIERKESLRLHCLPHHKDCLISAHELSLSYADRQIFHHISFEIRQGDIMAVCGRNGSGKSSLLKLIMGRSGAYEGDLERAGALKISYIDQDISHLQGGLRDYILEQGSDESLCKAILRKLGFARDLFDIDIKNYSDGQKKKLLIALSLSAPAHLFVWDEPLNYVDITARLQIEEILKEAKPTLVLVEHDRRFVKGMAHKILRL